MIFIAAIGTVSSIIFCKYVQSLRRVRQQEKELEESLQRSNQVGFFKDLKDSHSVPPVAPPDCIYCDYNATTPIYPEVFEAMVPYFTTHFGNPSSSHRFGEIAKEAVDRSRSLVKELINASDNEEIYFVSCGSEADNRCVDIALHHFKQRLLTQTEKRELEGLPVVICSSIEHPAILCYLRILQLRKQLELVVIGVNHEGFIDLTAFEESLTARVALVSVMHSNNEIGTIQPIRAIAKIIKRFNRKHQTQILLHSDAAQSIGKVPVDVAQLGVDLLTIVGHKFGAPKGIGALYITKGVTIVPMLLGGSQERGFRAGTENVPYIVSLGEASRLARLMTRDNALRLLGLKLRFLKKLLSLFSNQEKEQVRLNGPKRSNQIETLEEDLKMLKVLLRSDSTVSSSSLSANNDLLEQLPNTISLSFKALIGHQIVHQLRESVACSTGSACHALPAAHDSNVYAPSEVLLALGVDPVFGTGTIRISFGRFSTEEEVERAAEMIASTVTKMWTEKELEKENH